jgi:hypothetical protein
MAEFTCSQGKNVTLYDGPTYSIVTRDLNSYLLPQKGYLSLVFSIVADNANTPIGTDEIELHNSAAALFTKCSYFINSVNIDEVDYPGMVTDIVNKLEYSQDYADKIGPSQFYYTDDNGTIGAFQPASERTLRISQSKQVRIMLPLSRLFKFLDTGYSACMRGLSHQFDFVRNELAGQFCFHETNGTPIDNHRVRFHEMSIWMPRLLPSIQAETKFLEAVKAKGSALIPYKNWTGYRSNKFLGSTTDLTWQITTGTGAKKPLAVIVGLQLSSRTSFGGGVTSDKRNPAIYDNLDLKNIELRVNSSRYPSGERYQISYTPSTATAADQFVRNYNDLMRLLDKQSDMDNGTLVSYEDFGTIYPLYAFDLSTSHSLWENVMTTYMEVVLNKALGTDGVGDFVVDAVVCYDNEILLKSDGVNVTLVRGSK